MVIKVSKNKSSIYAAKCFLQSVNLEEKFYTTHLTVVKGQCQLSFYSTTVIKQKVLFSKTDINQKLGNRNIFVFAILYAICIFAFYMQLYVFQRYLNGWNSNEGTNKNIE